MEKRMTIAEAALEVLRETDNEGVAYGDSGLVSLIARRAEMKPCHPLNREQRVFAALERRPDLFKKCYYEHRGRLRRSFWLQQVPPARTEPGA